jgi:hypothetical protein
LRVFRTKEFSRYARRQGIRDEALCEAVARAERGLIDADLGGGLIKQRMARPGQGRSGGYRTLMAWRAAARTVFLYAFAKSERDNIEPDELRFWREVGAGFLGLDREGLANLLAAGELIEVNCHG